ncbi:MAG: phosphatase PAP2 family protein [Acetobacterium sp.]|nr:phosphatase PAP2 family protein [Bacillota bacterium]MCG2730724.1 phosphatase PAP2 family protein [Acetobacterium sp.]
MDLNILVWIHQYLVIDQLNGFFIIITNLWGDGVLAVLTTLLLILKKETRLTGIIILVSLLLNFMIVNAIIKPIVARPRPYTIYELQILLPDPRGFSFPSGHSASVFAFVWAYFITRKDQLRWILLVFALLVCFSRLYLFVHYPTDVLAGIVIGVICAILSKWFVLRFKTKPWMVAFLEKESL